jgi:hypothetical protein
MYYVRVTRRSPLGALAEMVSQEWYNCKAVGRAEVELAFEQWSEWKGLAYWLWDWSLPAKYRSCDAWKRNLAVSRQS